MEWPEKCADCREQRDELLRRAYEAYLRVLDDKEYYEKLLDGYGDGRN